jgi:hypothetical protein
VDGGPAEAGPRAEGFLFDAERSGGGGDVFIRPVSHVSDGVLSQETSRAAEVMLKLLFRRLRELIDQRETDAIDTTNNDFASF